MLLYKAICYKLSLFEAAACGSHLAVNKCSATANIAKIETVRWVDLDDQSSLNESLSQALEEEKIYSEILPNFNLENSLKEWERLFNDAL